VTTKPGWRSSEFWVTVSYVVGVAAFAIADKLPARYAAIATAIGAGAYAISRGLAKRPGPPPAQLRPPTPPTPGP
jgi:hypothetical protein